MGEALGAGAQGISGVIAGYNQGRDHERQQRFEQADKVERDADHIFKMWENAPNKDVANMLFEQYSQRREEADKLYNHKGPTAWKSLKNVFSHIAGHPPEPKPGQQTLNIPGLSMQAPATRPSEGIQSPDFEMTEQDPNGATITRPIAATDSGPMPMPNSAPPIQFPGTTGSVPSNAPQSPSFWETMRNNKPIPPALAHQDAMRGAVEGAAKWAGGAKSWAEVHKNPEMMKQLPSVMADMAAAGMNPQTFIDTWFQPHDTRVPIGAYGKDFGLPEDTEVTPDTLVNLVSANKDLKKKLENEYAGLVNEVSTAVDPRTHPQYQRLKSLQGFLHPDQSTQIPEHFAQGYVDKYGDTPDTQIKIAKDWVDLQNKSAQQYRSDRGNSFQFVANQATGQAMRFSNDTGKMDPILGPDNQPLYLGGRGKDASWLTEDVKGNVHPNFPAIMRDLGKTLTPEYAENLIVALQPNLPDAFGGDPVANPEIDRLKMVIKQFRDSSKSGTTRMLPGHDTSAPPPNIVNKYRQ